MNERTLGKLEQLTCNVNKLRKFWEFDLKNSGNKNLTDDVQWTALSCCCRTGGIISELKDEFSELIKKQNLTKEKETKLLQMSMNEQTEDLLEILENWLS